MTGRTHILAGLAAGAVVAGGNNIDWLWLTAALAAGAVGSLLPDIDHPSSRISCSSAAARTLSASVSAVAKHRGITHTLVFAGLCTFGLWLLAARWAVPEPVVLAFLAGILSHLVMDTLNEQGIMWLWPVSSRRISLLSIRTGGVGERLFRLAFAATMLLALLEKMKPYLTKLIE